MGLNKVLSSSPGQVDFLAGQVTFKAHLLNGPGPRGPFLERPDN